MFTTLKLPEVTVSDVLNQIEKSYKGNLGYKTIINKNLIDELTKYELLYLKEKNTIHNLSRMEKVGKFDKKVSRVFYEDKIVGLKIGDIYNDILHKLTLCPICKASAETLDHVLPKSKYIQYSITPVNLVPLCDRCNRRKGEHFSDDKERTPFHPYFDYIELKNYLEANYTIDEDENFIVIYTLSKDVEEKYQYNFHDLYKVNTICSSLANDKISQYFNIAIKFSSSLPSEKLKLLLREQIDYEKPKCDMLSEPWEIILYDLIIAEYDSFYEYVIKRRLYG